MKRIRITGKLPLILDGPVVLAAGETHEVSDELAADLLRRRDVEAVTTTKPKTRKAEES